MSQDVVLLEQWMGQRDAEAFHTLVSRHGAMVFQACRRVLRNDAEAEEVAQECFEALAIARNKPSKHLAAWLHAVATRKAISRMRSEQRRRQREEAFARTQPETEEVVWHDVYEVVDESLATLPEKYRECVLLHFFEGQTHQAIADQLDCSRSNVSYRINRGIDGLRGDLVKRGITVGGSALAAVLTENAQASAVLPASLTGNLSRMALAGVSAAAKTASNGVLTAVGTSLASLGFVKIAAIGAAAILGAAVLLSLQAAKPVPPTIPPVPVLEQKTPEEEAPADSTPEPQPVETAAVVEVSKTEAVETMASVEDVPEPSACINGIWDFNVISRDQPDESAEPSATKPVPTVVGMGYVHMSQDGPYVTLRGLDGFSIVKDTGVLRGKELSITFMNVDYCGSFNANLDRLTLNALSKVSAGDSAELLFLKADKETVLTYDRKDAGKKLAEALRCYAKAHAGQLPRGLSDLVPLCLPDLAFLENDPSLRIHYTPGSNTLRLKTSDIPSLDSINRGPGAPPIPDQLMALEVARRKAFGIELFWPKTIAHFEYKEPAMDLKILSHHTYLQVEEVRQYPLDEGQRTRCCQGNLRQLGRICKTFAAENDGYLPPGWYTAFPGYITKSYADFHDLTCPDTGGDNYELLFPATQESYLEDLAEEVSGIRFLSQTPVVIERQPHTHDNVGDRMVLFADGHVEAIGPDRWDQVVTPYLKYR